MTTASTCFMSLAGSMRGRWRCGTTGPGAALRIPGGAWPAAGRVSSDIAVGACCPDDADAFYRVSTDQPLPAELRGGVVAIGNFDGVHRGHQAVLDRALREGGEPGRPGVRAGFSSRIRAPCSGLKLRSSLGCCRQ